MDNISTNRKPIFQSEPIFSDEYLNEVLKLPADSKIVTKKIIQDRATDTARIIKLLITWEGRGEEVYKKNLFLKLPIINKDDNPFDKWSMHEIDFYRNVNSNSDLPIVKCYDAFISDDRKNYLLLLEDISDDFCSVNEIDRYEIRNWLNAAESLAKLHAFYWNGANSGELKLIHGDNKSMEEKIIFYHNALEKFLTYASDYYDKEILDRYNFALEDVLIYERETIDRRLNSKNVTVIHGDSHVYNLMFPKDPLNRPIAVDFQFWRMGLATIDIMNLMRIAFPFTNEPERYRDVLKHYHTILLNYGVTNYSFHECLQDYYLSTALAVFGPVYNYFDFGLGHEYWGQGVYDTLNNYKVAKELLTYRS